MSSKRFKVVTSYIVPPHRNWNYVEYRRENIPEGKLVSKYWWIIDTFQNDRIVGLPDIFERKIRWDANSEECDQYIQDLCDWLNVEDNDYLQMIQSL